MTPAEFESMCRLHDITFSYSDDHKVWQKGHHSKVAILNAAEELGYAIAAPIWNRVVKERLLSPFAEQFLWDEPNGQ